LIPAAKKYGIAGLSVTNSYNCGRLAGHTERLAREGLLAFGFTNAPASIAPVGGSKAVVGTNPMSMAAPDGKGGVGFVVDQSSSVVAKSEVMRHAARGESIPEGWALGPDGEPTTDPDTALQGSMVPIGGAKGAALALMVEVMSGCLAGAALSVEAGSLFEGAGDPPNLGQVLLAIDAQALSANAFGSRFKDLADKKHEIFDEDLQALVADSNWAIENERFKLVSLHVCSETGETPNATLVLEIDSKEVRAAADGSGPVDASFKAIENIVDSGSELQLYSVNNITSGTDAQGEVTVRLEKGGRVVNGQGADTDIVIASAKAYINACNKVLQPLERAHPQISEL
jgi:hypothetical protein